MLLGMREERSLKPERVKPSPASLDHQVRIMTNIYVGVSPALSEEGGKGKKS